LSAVFCAAEGSKSDTVKRAANLARTFSLNLAGSAICNAVMEYALGGGAVMFLGVVMAGLSQLLDCLYSIFYEI
jgi:hypothetical protein